MLSPLKKPESMYDIIFKAVTKKREAVQETAKKCKQLFKQKNSSADPEVLTQLEESLRARQDEQAIAKHLESSKPGASPEALAELKKSVGEKREDYECYIQDFLPALKTEITNSKKLNLTEKMEIEKTIMKLITLDVVSKNDNKDHSDSTMQNQNTTAGAVEVPSGANTSKLSSGSDLDSGIESPRTNEESLESPVSSRRSSISSTLSSTEEDSNPQKEETGNKVLLEQTAEEEPAQVSSQCLTLGSRKKENMDPDGQATQMTGSQPLQPEEKKNTAPIVQKPSANKNNSKGTPPDSTMQNQNTTAGAVEVPSGANTSKLSSGSDLDSGIESPRTNEESLESPVSSRRSSISSTLSSTEEDSNPQKEETGNKVLLEQTAEEESAQVSSQCLTLGSRKKENMDPDGQATQMTGSQPLQPEEKKNTAPIVQKPSANKNNSKGTPPEKQPNNRNLHVALVAGCALSTIGCIVAGAMTSGLVGAGLLAMAAVFAIAAVAELHSNFLSSKLTSINVSPLVNDKELTAL